MLVRILLIAAVVLLLPVRLAWSAVILDGDRVLIETQQGQVVMERGVVVHAENRLTGEVYTVGEPAERVAGLLWHNDPRLIDAKTKISTVREGDDRVQVTADLADGSRLVTTVGIEGQTGDILFRQRASAKRKGLYGVQWGIAGLDATRADCLVPGQSGMKLGMTTPARELGFHWPGSWEVQMMVVQGKQGGFCVSCRDEQMRVKALRWRRENDRVTLSFESHNHAPFENLTAVQSAEWRLSFFKGDWRVPAQRYRDWARKTFSLTPLEAQQPEWVREIRFVVITGMDTKLLDELKMHVAPSATLLYIPGWRRDGYDKNYPDYTGHERFKDFVRHAHALGYRVMPHMNYFGCDPKHEAYERFKKWHMRDSFTKEFLWWIPPRQQDLVDEEPTIKFAYINPASREWRDDLTRRLVAAHDEYDFDAIHLDQTLCLFNDANGRIDGLSCIEGNLALHKQLREAMPQVALSGEGLNEVTCRYEAFAQRHAPHAVSHVHGTWDEDFIACGHPISSYFLTPYTKIYGYLGLCNPSSRGLFLAWRRAYENWGVLPTLARPSIQQLQQPNSEVRSLLAEAQVWNGDRLVPDFAGPWSATTKFRLKGRDGVRALYQRDDVRGSRFLRNHDGESQTVYATIAGKTSLAGKGSIAGWLAFDEQRLFGLDPTATYTYLEEPRDHQVAHVLGAPENVVVRVPMLDDKKMMLALDQLPSHGPYEFVKQIDEADTGMIVNGQERAPAGGATFQAITAQCGFVRKPAIHAHPPWQLPQDELHGPRASLGRYAVVLPSDHTAILEFAVGLRDGVNERSDGVQFQVQIDNETVFDKLWDRSQWHASSVPLAKWAGRSVTITFITTTGPQGEASYDWACWGEPRIRFVPTPKQGEITVASPKSVREILGSDPRMSWSDEGVRQDLHTYKMQLTLPGRLALLWDKPRPVALPLPLAETPFDVSASIEGSPAQLPLIHVGAAYGSATSKGIRRSGINAHPPDHGRTSIDYLLKLPESKPISLEFSIGLRDGSQSESVVFSVEANTQEVYREQLTQPDGWHPAKVDLSAFAGKTLLLSLVVDADGSFQYDWAAWAGPVLK